MDDALPAGAITICDGGDSWTWVDSNPDPLTGTKSSRSAIAAEFHQHYFYGASATLPINPGDVLVAYVYMDPNHLPSEIMLQWNNGTWEHRAYWGANKIGWGADGTVSRRWMGPLPPAGRWVRLEVPANLVALEGSVLNGMAFTLWDGRANWDAAGKHDSGAEILGIRNQGTGNEFVWGYAKTNGVRARQ